LYGIIRYTKKGQVHNMAKAIYFDMDGTIANLYAVEGWLPMLRAYDPTPYANAEPMVRMAALARVLNRLQREGYTIGIVSWLSKEPEPAYDVAVTQAKLTWLAEHLPSVHWNEIHIVAHGVPKWSVVEYQDGILFDDEVGNRQAWKGTAYDVQNIIEVLRGL
jgi:hypothetical protein